MNKEEFRDYSNEQELRHKLQSQLKVAEDFIQLLISIPCIKHGHCITCSAKTVLEEINRLK